MASIKSKKVQSKIRMISNASLSVNSIRCEMRPAVAIKMTVKLGKQVLTDEAIEENEMDFLAGEKLGKSGKKKGVGASAKEIEKSWDDVLMNVFIEFSSASAIGKEKRPGEISRNDNIITANVSLTQLNKLIEEDDENDIVHVQLGQSLSMPNPEIRLSNSTPTSSLANVSVAHNGGKGVLIGIVDAGGFHFSHPDFIDSSGKTRFVSIWDQGGDDRVSPKGSYGDVIDATMMNAAIAESARTGIPATRLEPQSQMSEGSHATHVTSIAAGNSGVCPKAKIVGVLISLNPKKDYDRRRSFYDSTRIADAIEYLLEVSRKEQLPISINISLGTNGHAHDGSAPVSRWIDNELKTEGRSVCVAAGNAGQEKGLHQNDYGFIYGRIHTSGKIPSAGLEHDIEWQVVGNNVVDVSENELEIWYGAQDRFAISIKPPEGDWIGPIEPGEYKENEQIRDLTLVNIYNELYHPSNGSNYISVHLIPYMHQQKYKGIKSGVWRVRLHGRVIRDGNFHAWIERDNRVQLDPIDNEKWRWCYPSFFTAKSNVDNSSVSSLACGHEVIGVANLNEFTNTINISSSQGPTRDNRNKPDVAAPGTRILAANGFSSHGDWVEMTGTSMSSPYVCGVVGLMLEAEPRLTAAQIIGILKSTSQPLPGADYNWKNDAGYGVIQIDKCIEQAKLVNNNKDLTI